MAHFYNSLKLNRKSFTKNRRTFKLGRELEEGCRIVYVKFFLAVRIEFLKPFFVLGKYF